MKKEDSFRNVVLDQLRSLDETTFLCKLAISAACLGLAIFPVCVSVPLGLPCVCRKITLGKEKRYCYGVSIAPDGGKLLRFKDGMEKSYVKGPDTSGFETLSKEEFLEALREHEREGLCHTIWTFRTPFMGGI